MLAYTEKLTDGEVCQALGAFVLRKNGIDPASLKEPCNISTDLVTNGKALQGSVTVSSPELEILHALKK